MPKFPTFPYIFDEEKHISITNFSKWNYLELGASKSGVLTWTTNGKETGKINVSINKKNILTLDYKCNDTVYSYNVNLVSILSNLGTGKVWYFICPFTLKRCRKLHLIDEKFIHRSALPSGVYSKQIHSKKWRQMEKVYGSYFDVENYYEQLYSKHFKKFYNGKPTKRYLKLMQKISEAEKVSYKDIERLMVLGC